MKEKRVKYLRKKWNFTAQVLSSRRDEIFENIRVSIYWRSPTLFYDLGTILLKSLPPETEINSKFLMCER